MFTDDGCVLSQAAAAVCGKYLIHGKRIHDPHKAHIEKALIAAGVTRMNSLSILTAQWW